MGRDERRVSGRKICRIIVADEHPLFREGMMVLLERLIPDAMIEQAGNLEEVRTLATNGQPLDTLILEIRLPGLGSVSELAQLRQELKHTSMIVVSTLDDGDIIDRVMATGVDGFVGKSLSPDQVGKAIDDIRRGEVLVRYEPSDPLPLGSNDDMSKLTSRQREVWKLIAEGKTNKEIAAALEISPFTVRIHVSSLIRALNVPNRAVAAARFAGRQTPATLR
ncbi:MULTISPECIES: LuxR C-terminal-related transcriptional regulator [Pseudomonas]|jgi:DNA-binding NarL/FixJ family response regulator|uniref:Response regulator transcription factor n=1 Tax=Pseudomonas bijieensis TaxID=2681983 RepID=A0A6N1C8M5_9PSED|nr:MULTISPECIES: response regulator transcription factor [Pseudomonas]AXP03709.1 DNA-binding response regulator [Pseudomonas fluorescens]QKS80622.1 response regulator transcription factor [Pseudomonas bijieensis]BBH33856.1 NarL family response regulator [Pseudomonas sp. St290]